MSQKSFAAVSVIAAIVTGTFFYPEGAAKRPPVAKPAAPAIASASLPKSPPSAPTPQPGTLRIAKP
jgi:hypothetical protein